MVKFYFLITILIQKSIFNLDEQAFVQLKNGTLHEIGINSIILSQLQNTTNNLSQEKIDVIITHSNENVAYTYSSEKK
jgi:hypothetical protein